MYPRLDMTVNWTDNNGNSRSKTVDLGLGVVMLENTTTTISVSWKEYKYTFIGLFEGSHPTSFDDIKLISDIGEMNCSFTVPAGGGGYTVVYYRDTTPILTINNMTGNYEDFEITTNRGILLKSDLGRGNMLLSSGTSSHTITITNTNTNVDYYLGISQNKTTSLNTFSYTWTPNGVSSAINIYASTSKSISFNSNGGQGSMDSVEVEPNASVTLPKCTFTRTGYVFAGWALSSTGVVMYSDGQTITPTASMTLYAVWRVGVYEITLNWNGGSGTWDKIYYKTGAGIFDSENCTILVSAGALIVRAERAGYSFSSFTTNANGTGTIMFQNKTYMNSSTIIADDVWYAQWTVNNEAKYDSEGDYWYIENGKIPQTKVTNSTLISNLNKATTNGSNYYIAGQTLTAKVYSGKEYCKWNNNWYEVEPIRWRLTKDSNQSNGYGTETDTNAVLDKIVFVGQFSTTELGSGKGYSENSVVEFMKNNMDTTYMIRTTKYVDTFGTGVSLYGNQQIYTNYMFVSSQSEIEAVNGNLNITFSDLAKDMIKYYGGINSYFTRDLGSNYNNITCINAVEKETQCFATNFRGVQFTICFKEYACVG